MIESIAGSFVANIVHGWSARLLGGLKSSEATTLGLSVPPPARPLQSETPPSPEPPPPPPPLRRTVFWFDRKFLIYEGPWNTDWDDVSGLYILARRDPETDQGWAPFLIGASGSFRSDLPGVLARPDIAERGITHLHIHQAATGKDLRIFRERFVQHYQPELNAVASPANRR